MIYVFLNISIIYLIVNVCCGSLVILLISWVLYHCCSLKILISLYINIDDLNIASDEKIFLYKLNKAIYDL